MEPQPRNFAPASAQHIVRVLGAEGGSLRHIGDDLEYVGDTLVPAGEYELVRGKTRLFLLYMVSSKCWAWDLESGGSLGTINSSGSCTYRVGQGAMACTAALSFSRSRGKQDLVAYAAAVGKGQWGSCREAWGYHNIGWAC